MRCARRWRLASRVSKTMVVNVAENRNEEATRVVRRPQHTFSWGPDQGIHALDTSRVYANRGSPCLGAIVRQYFESYPDDRTRKGCKFAPSPVHPPRSR